MTLKNVRRTSQRLFCCVIIACALVTGCEKKPSIPTAEDTRDQLTASDLARLTDFHVWKGRIPEAEQPVKSIRLVIVKQDGSLVAKLFDTGNNLGREPCTSVLVGFKIEQGAFNGHLLTSNGKGGGAGWNINFTNAFASSFAAWSVPGVLLWNSNRAVLGRTGQDDDFNSILILELVK